MRDHEFWKMIADAVDAGKNVCLVTMLDSTGDGPNRPGAKMAVMPDRRIGTVGGGNSEKILAEKALEMLTAPPPVAELVTLSHDNTGENIHSGMICSGSQTFALVRLTLSDQVVLYQIRKALSAGTPGAISISTDGLVFLETLTTKQSRTFNADEWSYQESITIDTVTIIGGGHVALALTPLLHSLDMRIVVLDNRRDLDTMQRNTLAHDLRIVDYHNILPHIATGQHSYICIMTFAHEHDEIVLRQLATLDLKYLGMMGSPHKIKTIFAHLRRDGIDQAGLDKVHAPIGLNIGSNTPEEIAISIAAEIVAVRRGKMQ